MDYTLVGSLGLQDNRNYSDISMLEDLLSRALNLQWKRISLCVTLSIPQRDELTSR